MNERAWDCWLKEPKVQQYNKSLHQQYETNYTHVTNVDKKFTCMQATVTGKSHGSGISILSQQLTSYIYVLYTVELLGK